MKRLSACSLLFAFAVALSLHAQATPEGKLIDSKQLLLDLKTLSADDMQGRQVDTPGGAKARAYVIDRFIASGIAPFGTSYEEPFTFSAGRGTNAAERHGVNVVGHIDGSREPRRHIVVSAHYDHLGTRNGQVFNGADDNASGTAALFAIAKYFSSHKPANSILFVAFDGEESGRRGSLAFVKQPPVDAKRISIDLNADMIGRDADDKLFVVGPALQPFLKQHVEAIAANAPVKLLIGHESASDTRGAPKQLEDWTRDSDHYSFIQAKIPALYFGDEDFEQHHKATDDYETMTYGFYVKAVETLVQSVQYFDKNLDAVDKARAAASATQSAPATSAAATESSVELAIPSGKVVGTLLVPPGSGKKPVVLIIAGSGPTDRDGNQSVAVKANSYKLLAEALAAESVASLRYDKRGVAGSTVTGLKEADLRFEDFVGDAVQWIKRLRSDPRFSTVTVAGHSEGSLIGMLAARQGNADAFVSISGVARPAAAVIRDQLQPQLQAMAPLWENSQSILASLESGKTVDPLPDNIAAIPGLMTLFRPSVQPYMISWFKYSGATEIAKLKIPVAIIQGTTDIQVGVPEAQALAAARADAKLVIIEGMNHVLKIAPADRLANVATYTNPSLPIVPDVPKTIVTLAKGLR
jgi:pimeloyl-ACP methyl ester carboxylesterase